MVGLTGGIGSGKSTVGTMLAERGAIVIEADVVAREVVAPAGAAYAAVVERFPGVLGPDGTIDRIALASVVFADEAARKELEAITHPAIGAVMLERLSSYTDTDRIVVLDIPLLAEKGRMGVSAVIVVDCPEDVAVARLVAHRAFDPEDAWRRVGAQLSRDARRSLADFVVDNSGGRELLAHEVDRLWAWLSSRRALAEERAQECPPE